MLKKSKVECIFYKFCKKKVASLWQAPTPLSESLAKAQEVKPAIKDVPVQEIAMHFVRMFKKLVRQENINIARVYRAPAVTATHLHQVAIVKFLGKIHQSLKYLRNFRPRDSQLKIGKMFQTDFLSVRKFILVLLQRIQVYDAFVEEFLGFGRSCREQKIRQAKIFRDTLVKDPTKKNGRRGRIIPYGQK